MTAVRLWKAVVWIATALALPFLALAMPALWLMHYAEGKEWEAEKTHARCPLVKMKEDLGQSRSGESGEAE